MYVNEGQVHMAQVSYGVVCMPEMAGTWGNAYLMWTNTREMAAHSRALGRTRHVVHSCAFGDDSGCASPKVHFEWPQIAAHVGSTMLSTEPTPVC